MRPRYSPCPPDHDLEAGFGAIRAELGIVAGFADDVLAEAAEVARHGPRLPDGVPNADPVDHRGLELVSIDPPGSRDIDQAFGATRTRHGYAVHYAIADLASFVTPGGAIDAAARARGVTFYSPDRRAPLHPPALNHDAASLVPGEDRAALLWTIDVDHDGSLHRARLERALVRNREAISYREAQDRLARPDPPQALALLREIGRLRQELERRRHAVSLQLPDQEIAPDGDSYRLVYHQALPVEGWNAQISLLTGMAAAELMVDAGVGILRTLPPPDRDVVAELRRVAAGLRVGWDDQVGYAERVRELDATIPNEAALVVAAARGLRGAGYVSFRDGQVPGRPEHSAIASVYSHVTAPLRRLCDRFANEIVLAICGEHPVPEWALAALDEVPSIMGAARSRESSLERAQFDYMEAVTLRDRIGDQLDAVVSGRRGDRLTVTVADPAIIAPVQGEGLELGQRIHVRVAAADPDDRRVELVAEQP